ncbi:hypothetical protein [Sulfurimonas sp. RIFOXYB12_FULL_35_9]|jgi:hypothetical protein|uniref:hypothetical protein n=1 Tax=Sulfurimonas sp. RIFOXYB12_FULL_35_9 TaxID=1802256 RepID=UPI0008B495D8|nr:hypothetical protein [Sulfurimonas sp. RIFOXYB12_FULL_35_9]OHE05837.1 MAG: hypothetical protein A2345_02185 [Sulfurimonas sp. RIFOXYB12_FULL_35_9]
MKKVSLGILAILSTLNFNGCASDASGESPIKIEIRQQYDSLFHSYFPEIIITSVVDKLKINDVIVNKGNCKYRTIMQIVPSKLTFGKQLGVPLNWDCKVLKIDVKTDQGDWTVNF